MKVKSESEVAQSCPTLSDPMDCSPPGSSIHGIFQARVLEWGAIAFSESEEELKFFMRVKEKNEKANLNIKKTKIIASSPITSWQIEGEKVEAVTDLLFLRSKITADSDCSHEIRRRLLLGRKTMTNLDSVLKSRDITLLTKFHIVKAMVFPVVIYGCESWTIRKTEHQRIDAFEL